MYDNIDKEIDDYEEKRLTRSATMEDLDGLWEKIQFLQKRITYLEKLLESEVEFFNEKMIEVQLE